jgi:hypothetical protein
MRDSGVIFGADRTRDCAALLADQPRRLDAVHPAGEANVHQHQVGVEIGGLLDGAIAVGHEAAHFEALLAHQRFQVPSHQQFVFANQDAGGPLRRASSFDFIQIRCQCHDTASRFAAPHTSVSNVRRQPRL